MATFNFSSLQQKADQVIHNADEAVRKWQEFISAPAGNVNFQYYDKNGNLQTATFPNRNKIVNDFIANVNNAMEKRFYVDAINGSDNNDGSSTTPFKTPKKAIDSVPVGGRGIIYVKGDVVIDQDINITGKHIIVVGQDYDYTNSVATQTIQNSTTADAKIIVASGIGFMLIEGFDITANDGGSTQSHWSTLFKCFNGTFSIILGTYPKPFNLNINHSLVNCENGLCHIHIRQATINTTLTTTTPLLTKSDNGLFIYSETAITDNTNGIITRPAVGTIY